MDHQNQKGDDEPMNADRMLRAAGSFTGRRTVGTLGRFGAVGMLNTVLDLALFAVLGGWLALPALAANTLAYGTGIVNSFVWNRRWTFAHRPRQHAGRQFARFALVSLSALLLNDALVLSLAALFNAGSAGLAAAKLIATAAGLLWNFTLNNHWTFRTPAPGRAANDARDANDSTD